MSNLNLALYGMCFTRLPMRVSYRGSSSASMESNENDTEWLEQHWRSSNGLSGLKERLEANVDFHDAAMESIGGACEEMALRFQNLVRADNEIKRGYIAGNFELCEFVQSLSSIDDRRIFSTEFQTIRCIHIK